MMKTTRLFDDFPVKFLTNPNNIVIYICIRYLGRDVYKRQCDIFVSDALKSINEPMAMHVSVGIGMSNDLLQIDIASVDVTADELYDILRAYRKRRKYYRLMDGRLLSLEGKELEEMCIRDSVGNYYGTPMSQVEKLRNEGKNVLLEIEVQGATQVKEKCPDALTIFIIPPSMEELENRIRDVYKRQVEERCCLVMIKAKI